MCTCKPDLDDIKKYFGSFLGLKHSIFCQNPNFLPRVHYPPALPPSVFAESIKLCILFKARKVAHIYPSMLKRKKQNY